MTWEQFFMQAGLTVLSALGVALFVKWLVEHRLSKDLEKFKAELQRAAFEHQTRYGKLHEKRMDAVAALYRSVLDVQDNLQILVYYSAVSTAGPGVVQDRTELVENLEKARADVTQAMGGFRNHRREAAIYLDDELCRKLKEFDEQAFGAEQEIELDKSSSKLTYQVEPLREALRQEFRRLLISGEPL